MKTVKDKKVNAKLKRAATGAFKKAMKSLEQEPEVVIVVGDGSISEQSVQEITSWLFHRRDENGS